MACRSAVTSPHTTTVHTLIRISTVRMGGRGWWRRRRCDVRRTSRGAGRRFRVEMAGRGTVCPVWRPGASPWHGSDQDVYVGVLREQIPVARKEVHRLLENRYSPASSLCLCVSVGG